MTATAGAGKVGGGTVRTPAGKRGELTFKLGAKGEQALGDKGDLRVRLTINVRYGKFAHVTTTRSFRVQGP